MEFKVSYGKSTWAYVCLDSTSAGLDHVEDMDDRAICLASYIVRECIEDADGWTTFSMDDVIVCSISGESSRQDADTLDVPLPDDHGTFQVLVEQCETLVKLHDIVEANEHSLDRLLATIVHEEWDSFDFDDTKYWDEQLFTSFDEDDYEEFAKYEMETCDTEIPEHQHKYFDFDQYGQDVLDDDYYHTTFNGVTYVFNKC